MARHQVHRCRWLACRRRSAAPPITISRLSRGKTVEKCTGSRPARKSKSPERCQCPSLSAHLRQKALLAGKWLTDEEAAQWVTAGAPRIPYTAPPGLPESGAALRAAALALSAKAIAIQAQRLKELRAASQIN